ncbi:MAG TPA: helix-turn-helix domain-containing protein [Acidobacteriaceae bacterium]|nr:helix-turn-helix domain-containing protein [Acidobacteriaceae bacterium]
MSTVLAVGVLQGLAVALLLLGRAASRVANRFLAAFVFVTVLRIVPYAIGYAGFYDAYPWLSFAPYNLSLAFGPLIFLYVVCLSSRDLPSRWPLHLAPAAAQLAYYLLIFPQSLSFKNHWDLAVQDPWVVPLEQTATFVSSAIYLWAAARHYRSYRRSLNDQVSFAFEFRLSWIRNFLFASIALVLTWGAFVTFARFVRPLNYFNEFWLYVVFAVFVEYLALEGWRHAGDDIPIVQAVPAAAGGESSANTEAEAAKVTPQARDWQEQGRAWLHEIEARELWRNPDLTAAMLARELGTNTTYLSRALNEGLGQTFSECINRLRVTEVQRMLTKDTGRDLLAIAFEAGFRSKASFNRAFKLHTRNTPSGFRSSAAEPGSQMANSADI